jgi:UDP-N-acetylglucosamine pyrophosphorylase
MNIDNRLAIVIMAAGKGTRMNNPDMAKVMYEINDKPIIGYVVDLAHRLGSSRTVVVVGWQKDSVIGYLENTGLPVVCVEQEPQLGTGHAVMQAERALDGFDGDVLVLSGDVPMLSHDTVRRLIDVHRTSLADATVLTCILDNPAGYGRIIRDREGAVVGIVEEKDATEKQRSIREMNSGIYVFDKAKLFRGLRQITPENEQKEYYLTDILGYVWENSGRVGAVVTTNPMEIQGINTVAQLEQARMAMR